jgi:CHAP domain-containing protein
MWWEQAYPGAPPPGGLIPLARPLYPPDAAEQGKKPSSPGPDCEAIKRGISRGGRWPWQPFDQAYSNGFAHGTSGNVGESGVAGFQRQQHIDDTGWWGKVSNDALQYALVPDGLPHAGDHLLDATARDLLQKAYDMYGGAEPAPPTSGKLRERALEKAADELGYTENPAGSNNNKYGSWYGLNYQPWCAMFVTWAYEQSGDSPSFVKGSRYSYCPYVVADARANRYGLTTTDDPIPGDLVVYDWSQDTIYDHIGIFETWTGSGVFNAVEGNTSTSSNSNGGQVMRRERNRYAQGTVFIRVAEP